MLDLAYFYVSGAGLFYLIWLFLYAYRRDLRKNIFIVGLVFGIGGVLSQFVYTNDWWRAITLIGIEDFVYGLSVGGIASVCYMVFFKKKFVGKRRRLLNFECMSLLSVFLFLFFGGFFIFNINSFYSSILAFGISTVFIFYKRQDLIKCSIYSGIIMVIIGAIMYFVLMIFFQGFFQEFWFLEGKWYHELFFGIPLNEYIWYFLAGAFIGPLYAFCRGRRLKDV